MMNRIPIAYDGFGPAKEAMNFVFGLACHYNNESYVIAVCQLPEFSGEVEVQDLVSRTQSYLSQMMRDLKRQYPELKKEIKSHVVMGHPAEQILRYADTHSTDHIVVGHRGKTLFSHWLLGFVARQVIDHALCPVTVVRK